MVLTQENYTPVPGDIQLMVFKPRDEGPFQMTRDEQEKTNHDQIIGGQRTRTVRKAKLKALLEAKELAKLFKDWYTIDMRVLFR